MANANNAFTIKELRDMQERPFYKKITVTQAKLIEFCIGCNWQVAVSFSGGADSSVLLDILGKVWSSNKESHGNSPLMIIYANTSNEFISMPKHVDEFCEYIKRKYEINLTLKVVRGKINFVDVCKKVGYPVCSKKVARMVRSIKKSLAKNKINYEEIKNNLDNKVESANYLKSLKLESGAICYLTGITSDGKECASWKLSKKWRKLITAPFDISEECCGLLKKHPLKLAEKEMGNYGSIIGTLAEDSDTRREGYLKLGCNSFGTKNKSQPMGFWMRQDVLRYLKEYNIPVAEVYGSIIEEGDTLEFSGEPHTGCKLCLFGCHLEKGSNRIQRLKTIEPSTYNFAMKPVAEGGLGYSEIMEYLGIEKQ